MLLFKSLDSGLFLRDEVRKKILQILERQKDHLLNAPYNTVVSITESPSFPICTFTSITIDRQKQSECVCGAGKRYHPIDSV